MKRFRWVFIWAAVLMCAAFFALPAHAETFVLCGQEVQEKASRLDLTGIEDGADVEAFVKAAPTLTRLRTVVLGDESVTSLSWEALARMMNAAPKARFHYSFRLYGVPMTLDEEYIDLRRISIKDNAETLISALPCLKQARFLDLDTCDLPEERIMEIRAMFPEIRVIWRVSFSTGYSVRTDVKTILASYVGDFGLTDDESCKPLTYCIDVVNLDLGHNNIMTTVDFVRYMPNLEVLIVAKDDIKDISALAECKKLRYLELYMNPRIEDLSPLAGLTELRDLEIGLLPKVTDLSPLYDLELDRLWIGTETGIPPEQIEEYSRRHPNCVINLTDDEIDSTWRYQETHGNAGPAVLWPQYQKIRDIFRYGSDTSWSFAGNDPYFYMGPGMIPHEKSIQTENTSSIREIEVSEEDDEKWIQDLLSDIQEKTGPAVDEGSIEDENSQPLVIAVSESKEPLEAVDESDWYQSTPLIRTAALIVLDLTEPVDEEYVEETPEDEEFYQSNIEETEEAELVPEPEEFSEPIDEEYVEDSEDDSEEITIDDVDEKLASLMEDEPKTDLDMDEMLDNMDRIIQQTEPTPVKFMEETTPAPQPRVNPNRNRKKKKKKKR